MPMAELDLRLEKAFHFGKMNFSLWADAFNILGYYYFTYPQSQLVGGNIYANGSFARFPRYGQPNAAFGTTEFSFGARIRF